MAKSSFIILLSGFFLALLLLNLVSANVEEHVYVSFNGNNAHVKQVVTMYAQAGYYLPSFTYSDIFYPSQKNLMIHDGDGKTANYKIVEQNENYTIYNITVPQIGDSQSYGYDFLPSYKYIYYEYDLDNVVVNYLKNYKANIFLISNNDSYSREVYFCLPYGASYPEDYDSRPAEPTNYNNPYQLTIPNLKITAPTFNFTKIISLSAPPEPEQSFCSGGVKESVFSDRYTDYLDLASHSWSDPSSSKGLSSIEGNKISISIPEGYSDSYDALKRSEETLPYIEQFGLSQPDHYSIFIVDDNDKVLTYGEKQGIVCYEDGKCYITNDILFEDKQFHVVNVVSSYFLASFLKTFGQELDTKNWYIQGESNYLAMKAMDFAKLENDKIREFRDSNLTEAYGGDFMSSDIQGQVDMLLNTRTVTDIENACPDHTKQVLENLNTNDVFTTEVNANQFDNLILASYGEYCNTDNLFSIFERNNLPFDKDKILGYLEISKNMKNSNFNLFQGKAEKDLQASLIEAGSNSDDLLKSAKYWSENGTAYTIIMIIVGIGILGLVIFLFIKNKNKVKHSFERITSAEARNKSYIGKSPLGIKIISILIYISAVILAISGLVTFVDDFFTALILVLWGVFQFYVGMSLNKGKNWARVLIIVVSALGLIYSISLLASDNSGLGIVYLIINIALILYFSFNEKVLSFYSRN